MPYLYYVNGADGCGELVFSTGYAEFERNAAAYQEAVKGNGGREPKGDRGDRSACEASRPPSAHAVATRLGVLGWPVAHSRSPAMHTAALARARARAEWSYQRLPVPPELFAETTRALGGAASPART